LPHNIETNGRERLKLLEEIKVLRRQQARYEDLDRDYRLALQALENKQEELANHKNTLGRIWADLENSRNKYRALFELAPVGYLYVNGDGLITDVNQALSEMLGFPKNRLLSSAITDLADQDNPGPVSDFLSRILDRKTGSLELTITGGHGRTISVRMEGVPIASEPDQAVHGLIAVTDITMAKEADLKIRETYDQLEEVVQKRTREWKLANQTLEQEIAIRSRTEQELWDREERLRQLTDNIREVFWLLDPHQDSFLYVSPAYEEIWGRWPHQYPDDPNLLIENVHPEDRNIFSDLIHPRSDQAELFGVFRVIQPQGDIRWVQGRTFPIPDAQGRTYRFAGVMEDITDRKIMELENQRKTDLLQAVFDHIPVMIRLFDSQRKSILVNKEYQRVLGWSIEDVNREDFLDLCYPDPQDRQKVMAHLKNRQTGWCDFITKTKTGVSVHTSWANVDLPDGSRIGIGLDITERRAQEEQILAYQGQLRTFASKLNAARDREKRRIAVDLHDRIAQALTLAKMKLAKLKNNPALDAYHVQLVQDVLGLINDSVGESSSLILDLRPPVLYELGLVEALYELVETMEEKHGLQGAFTHNDDYIELTEDLRSTSFRIVRELLMNIAKHSQATEFSIQLFHKPDSICIEVNDNGVGFDTSSISPLSENRTLSFGLFSCREEARHLGGYLTITSAPGKGTSAVLNLPLPLADPDARPEVTAADQS
jgi:PAS domain S-box-containing protein